MLTRMPGVILLIDDDPVFRGLARRVLTASGLEVGGEAASVAEARALARQAPFAAAMIDVGLPDGSGIALASELAALPGPPRLVLVSSDPDAAEPGRRPPLRRGRLRPQAGAPQHRLGAVARRRLATRQAVGYGCRVSPPVRVVVGEDDVLMREGIVRVLADAGFDVVAHAGDADSVLRRALAHRPDVVVTDIQMPPRNEDDGLQAALELRRQRPEIGVLVLSQYFEEHYALDLLGDRPEGVGYLLKERVGDVEVFAQAVARVAAGGSALDPVVVGRMLGRNRPKGPLDELPRASGTSSGPWPRASRTRASPRSSWSPRPRSRST